VDRHNIGKFLQDYTNGPEQQALLKLVGTLIEERWPLLQVSAIR
jgi:hypothetical protein